jgi:acyl-CoA thioester hydrolase
MRVKPFSPVVLNGDERFVRDETSGLVWHRTASRTLYIDTDRSGVVYHSNYLRYFELGRVTVMRDVGFPYAEVEERGFVYPVVETGLKYHHPLFYDDPMWIHTRPDRLDRVRVGFSYLITHAESGVVICTGFTLHCALGKNRTPTAVDPQTTSTWQNFPK